MRSFEIKLDRAFEHLQCLIAERSRWLVEGQAYTVTEDRQMATRDQPGYYVKWIDPEPIPTEFSAVAGDCLSNFRSALDHLVYELGVAHSGQLTRRQARDCAFPIFGERPPTPKQISEKIGCIHPSARTAIQRMQPHHRGVLHVQHPLWILHSLVSIDKHRTITVMFSGAYSTFMDPMLLQTSIVHILHGPIEGRTRVITQQWTDPHSNMKVDFEQTFDITFPEWDRPASRAPVISTLTDIGAFIRTEVVDRLVKYLD